MDKRNFISRNIKITAILSASLFKTYYVIDHMIYRNESAFISRYEFKDSMCKIVYRNIKNGVFGKQNGDLLLIQLFYYF